MESKLIVLAVAFAIVSSVAALSINPKSTVNARSFGTHGVVTNLTRCGGFGTPLQLRISDCEGRCSLHPGTRYDAEFDLIPSSAAASLSLGVDLVFNGTPVYLFEAELPNSSVQPGLVYTVRFSFVPNDVLEGETVKLRAKIFHTEGRRLEICVETEVDIEEF